MNDAVVAALEVRGRPSVPANADLAITAVAVTDPRANGNKFTYSLTVRNNGPTTATAVRLTNDLPQNIALHQITPSQGTCGGTDPVLCTLGTLTSGTEATVMMDVVRTQAGTFPSRAAINGDQQDLNIGNNFAVTNALNLPTPQATCNRKRCTLRLTCNASDLLGRMCDNQVTLLVRVAASPRSIRLAATVRNIPGGQTEKVRLNLTPKGKNVVKSLVKQGTRRLRGMMEIKNSTGGTDIIRRLAVRLR